LLVAIRRKAANEHYLCQGHPQERLGCGEAKPVALGLDTQLSMAYRNRKHSFHRHPKGQEDDSQVMKFSQ
jgi:hypothetical protein